MWFQAVDCSEGETWSCLSEIFCFGQGHSFTFVPLPQHHHGGFGFAVVSLTGVRMSLLAGILWHRTSCFSTHTHTSIDMITGRVSHLRYGMIKCSNTKCWSNTGCMIYNKCLKAKLSVRKPRALQCSCIGSWWQSVGPVVTERAMDHWPEYLSNQWRNPGSLGDNYALFSDPYWTVRTITCSRLFLG